MVEVILTIFMGYAIFIHLQEGLYIGKLKRERRKARNAQKIRELQKYDKEQRNDLRHLFKD